MGIFDRIQDEIDQREDQEGITPADLLDLPAPLRRLMNRITREGSLTVAAAAKHLEESEDSAREMLDSLVGNGYLEREEHGEGWVYRTRFGRKRGRKLPGGIWSALGQRAKDK
jgi:predicted ArsR family transcriptional regulator